MATLTQIIICFILIIPTAVITLIVVSNAGKKGLSGPQTLGWIIVSICFFPIGFLLYFLFTRQKPKNGKEGEL